MQTQITNSETVWQGSSLFAIQSSSPDSQYLIWEKKEKSFLNFSTFTVVVDLIVEVWW